MSATAVSEPPRAALLSPTTAAAELMPVPVPVEPEGEERGRLKRRRLSSMSPRRASSPSRGHDRTSGSRYRQHHRKHHRPSSPASSISPPNTAQKKTRRRSDAEPDHTFRGRARNRSGSRGRTRSPILEGEDGDKEGLRSLRRRRSQPPSRHKIEQGDRGVELRRQWSYHTMYKASRRDPQGDSVEKVDSIQAERDGSARTEQVV